MKNLLLVSGLCLLLCGCGEDVPPSKPGSSYTPPTYNKSEPAVTAPAQPAAQAVQPAAQKPAPAQTAQPAAATAPANTSTTLQRPATQITNDAAAVVNYGTGSIPLNVKKKQEDKLQAIQNQYNRGTNKAINDK